jgi:uncharacterized membrane protein YozB (DUF420 family)
VRLVSINLDPARDSAQSLKNYARDHGADPQRWLLLTGEQEAIDTIVPKIFLQALERHPEKMRGEDIDHSFRLLVIDQYGRLRGSIENGKDPAQVELLSGRVKELVQGIYLPRLNASLNGVSTVLLVLGYVAIRRRWVRFHKSLMLAALAVSAAFLASYLYYHVVVQRGSAQPFGGAGAIATFYYTVLFSHIVLAAVVAPLALITAGLGLRGRLSGHVWLARWTLPLWLYVSVTGVVVYWMLYQLYPPFVA